MRNERAMEVLLDASLGRGGKKLFVELGTCSKRILIMSGCCVEVESEWVILFEMDGVLELLDASEIAWSSLISAYALHGEARAALQVFYKCSWQNCGLMKSLHYFDRMHEDYIVEATADHYSCLVDALSRAGRTYGEVELAEIAGRALLEIEPSNAANYVLLARIYTSVGRYEEVQRMRMEMKEMRVNVATGSCWVENQG
ncbi:hypothetical protein REPUB_Repub01dG0136200 [Reevesia pubescens]